MRSYVFICDPYPSELKDDASGHTYYYSALEQRSTWTNHALKAAADAAARGGADAERDELLRRYLDIAHVAGVECAVQPLPDRSAPTAVNRFYHEIHVPDLVAAEDIPPPAASAAADDTPPAASTDVTARPFASAEVTRPDVTRAL